jgi:membrane-associated phospholipid phosphatase
VSEPRRTLLLASLTPFLLFVLLGVAAGHGWLGTAELDSPSSGIRDWAAHRPWLEDSLFFVERLFATQGLTIATIVLAGWLLLRRQFRAGVLVVVVMLAERELSQYAKELFGRDRPMWQDSDFLHHAGSYPSGHASGVVAFGGLVILLTVMATRRRDVRRLVSAAVISVVALVFADRLLLGRHYPTDLLGGALLSTGLVLLGASLIYPLFATREVEDSEATPIAVPDKELAAR